LRHQRNLRFHVGQFFLDKLVCSQRPAKLLTRPLRRRLRSRPSAASTSAVRMFGFEETGLAVSFRGDRYVMTNETAMRRS
jgi:hypothetical protein